MLAQSTLHSPINDEDVAGFPDDLSPVHEDVVKIVTILEDAGIPCCFIAEYALIYYGAGRIPNVGAHLSIPHQAEQSIDMNFCLFRIESYVSQIISTRKPSTSLLCTATL